MELNQQQVRTWLQLALSAGGPFAAIILSKTGVSEGDYALYVNLALAFLPGVIVGAWSWYSNRKVAQVAVVAQMPAADQHEALNKVSDVDKIRIAEAVPEVATVVIKDVANGPVAAIAADDAHPNIVTETQNEADAKKGTKV